MAKVKVSELRGELLDYWVGKAEGMKIRLECGGCYYTEWINDMVTRNQPYSPSMYWSQGGPIIEREEIFPSRFYGCSESNPNKYQAGGLRMSWERGPTPLIAAMRCYVASKFGEEVDDGE